jgi:hypothetical protein
MRGSGEPPLGPTDAVSRDMPPTGLVPHPVIDPSRAQTMLTVLTQIPRFVSGNWVEATAAGLYPAILEGTLVTQSSRKIPPMKESAMNTWTVAAAKAKFSEVIELARSRGPQTITAAMWSRVKLGRADELAAVRKQPLNVRIVQWRIVPQPMHGTALTIRSTISRRFHIFRAHPRGLCL